MSYTDFDFPHTHMYESDLREILAQLKDLSKDTKALKEWKITHAAEYEQLKQLYDDVMSGNLPPEIESIFVNWMSENAIDIVGEMVKTVHFGLTNDGYFCAMIPSSWADVQFDTVNDYDDPLYGHLLLIYD